jgi:hypothetical protein
MIHRLLCWLGIRNEFDYAAPCDRPNEPHHPYERHLTFRPGPDNSRSSDIPVGECCARCGGGRLHAVHSPPWAVDDTRSMSEEFAGGSHQFERGEDGHCAKCGGGRFYPIHARAVVMRED